MWAQELFCLVFGQYVLFCHGLRLIARTHVKRYSIPVRRPVWACVCFCERICVVTLCGLVCFHEIGNKLILLQKIYFFIEKCPA